MKGNVTYSIIYLQQLLCNIATCIPAVWCGIRLQLTEKLSCVLSTQCRAVVATPGADLQYLVWTLQHAYYNAMEGYLNITLLAIITVKVINILVVYSCTTTLNFEYNFQWICRMQ